MTTAAVAFWGDSLVDQMVRTVGSPATAGYTELVYPRGGVGGESTPEILARFIADRTRRNWNQVWWGGFNGFNATQIKADIAAWIASMTHGRWLVMGVITNANTVNEQGPSGSRYLEIIALNNELRALYGERFFDVQEFLMYYGQSIGDAASLTYLGPPSTYQPSAIHLTAAGYNAVLVEVRRIFKSLGYLTVSALHEQILASGGSLNRYFTPTITSSNSASGPEGRPITKSLTADKANVIWAITGGADMAHFSFVENNIYERATLKILGKDYEAPEDAGLNNTYVVDVAMSDGLGHGQSQTVIFTFTDTDDSVAFTETSDYTARHTTAPNATLAPLLDAYVRKLIAADIWSKVPGIYLCAVQDAQAALLNMKGATGPLTNFSTPHIAYQGFLGNSIDQYLESVTLQTLDPTLNNSNLGCFFYSLSDVIDDGIDIGFSDTANIKVQGRNSSSKLSVKPMSAVGVDTQISDSDGFYGFQRTSPRDGFIYKNGTVIAADIGDTIDMTTGKFQLLCGQNTNFSNRIMSAFFITKDLTTAEVDVLYEATQTFMDAILLYLPAPDPAARFTCYFEGVDGATTAIDEGGGKTITFVGNAHISTTDPISGTSSLVLDGTGDRLTLADSPDWQLTGLEFSFGGEFQVASFGAAGHFSTTVGHWNTTGNQRSYQIRVSDTGRLQFIYSIDGINSVVIQSAASVVTIGPKYKYLVDRDTLGKIRLYLGVIGVDTLAPMIGSSVYAGDFFNSNALFTIGDIENGANSFAGKIDAVIFWKDIALAASDAGWQFAPPPPPVEMRRLYDSLRFASLPDLTPYGVIKLHVEYESGFWPSGVSQATRTANGPNLSYIQNTAIPRIRNANPGITHLVIDIEAWDLFTTNATDRARFITYHNQVMQTFHTYWPEVKVSWYGEVPIRDLNHLTGSPSVNITRTAAWHALNDECQSVADNADFLCPSVYGIGTADTNETLYRTYAQDMFGEAKRMAVNAGDPDMLIIGFLSIEYRAAPSHTDTLPWVVTYNRLDAAYDVEGVDGIALWSVATGSPTFATSARTAALDAGTSTTSLVVATGNKTFTTQSGKSWPIGTPILARSAASPKSYMLGDVVSYSGTTLTIGVTQIGEAGTHADWSIEVGSWWSACKQFVIDLDLAP